MTKSLNDLNLSSDIINALEKQNITVPTEIQSLVINEALENKDIIGESFTGSGKTLAYLLPIFERINTETKDIQAIILAPTHELVMQIEAQIKLLSDNSGINVKSLGIIGDVNINNQIKKLKEVKPHIIVGSTGRVLDLIRKKKITAHTIKTIVIDEVDNLLDPKRAQIVKDIIKTTMRDRQLMAFSASITPEIVDSLKELMKDPLIVKSQGKSSINPNISHVYVKCDRRDKFEVLRKIIAAEDPKRALIFVNDNKDIELTSLKLNYHNRDCFAMSGSISKEERKNAIDSFKTGKIKILVSSDVSARGLDITDITHVFNLDLPLKLDEYLHRSGRTARGNAKGTSICIVTDKQMNIIKKYEKAFDVEFQEKIISNGVLKNKDK
ncbi:DEAD/DEAH box helicase [Clostridium botulinum]|uniref:DEAD/DEAH box helicase n=1 Tax=Clostridium botulinum TaxID=1491 RepID=UPI00144C2028|nr:DEAD/DEAH box helicase [Clostridium botulinum]NFO02713.1 DEAD/DEAH box helicase [Clostridium botulinum]UZP04699.1 DEAD/DEAH box helicase [Clostridium botulinum]UZP08111.1 DEAD/DEAH box helicase [Clostridium botulinum]UZP11438.1 DEAD/DEAH box helicase [Clostridium botulinum]